MNTDDMLDWGMFDHSPSDTLNGKQLVTSDRLAAQIVKLVQKVSLQPELKCTPSHDASYVRAVIMARNTRNRLFDGGLFGEPVWDILLDLTAATIEKRFVSVSSLCIAARVPTSTAIRCIKTMVDAGLVERRDDPDDARRTYIVLLPDTFAKMMLYLDQGKRMFMRLAVAA